MFQHGKMGKVALRFVRRQRMQRLVDVVALEVVDHLLVQIDEVEDELVWLMRLKLMKWSRLVMLMMPCKN